MKKWIRVTLIVAACVLAVGLLTGGMGLYMFWATADRYTPENPVDRDYAVDASALTSLRVDVSLGSVRIVPVPAGESARVETRGYGADDLRVTQEDGALTIESADGLRDGTLIDLGLFRIDLRGRLHMGSIAPRSVTLYLPEAELRFIDVSTNAGDFSNAMPLRADAISITSSVGSLTLQNLDAQILTLTNSVGEIDLDGFSCETLTASVDTGDLTLRNGSASVSADIRANIGDATLQDVALTGLTFNSDLGDALLDGTLRGACSLETNLGDLTLRFADRAENYFVTLEPGMGDLSVHNADLVRTDGEPDRINPRSESENRISISTSMGDLDLSFAE